MGPRLRVLGVGLLVGLGVLLVVGTAGSATAEWTITGGGTGGFEGSFTNTTGNDTDHVTLRSLDTSNPIEAMDIEGGSCRTSAGVATCEVDVRPSAGTRFSGSTAQKLVPNGAKFEACTYANPGSAGGSCQTVVVGGGGGGGPKKTETENFAFKAHRLVGKANKPHEFVQTTITGVGHLVVPAPTGNGALLFSTSHVGGGSVSVLLISLHHNLLLDEERFSYRVTGGSFDQTGFGLLIQLGIRVTKESAGGAKCHPGAKGTITAFDGSVGSPPHPPDSVDIAIPRCILGDHYKNTGNGETVAVAIRTAT